MIRAEMDAHLVRLLWWSFAWFVAGLVLLYRADEFRRGFASLSAGWCVVNLIIVFFGFRDRTEPVLGQTREFLAFNLGLNIAYMAVGITLVVLGADRGFQRGAGYAVLIQGLALLVLDGILLSRLPSLAAR